MCIRDREREKSKSSTGGSVVFGVFGLIGLACLVTAAFCGIRWFLLPVPISTEEHLAQISEIFDTLSAAELIRNYEDLEENDLDLSLPYTYKTAKLYRDNWGQNASIAGIVGLTSFAIAFFAISGKRKKAG